jgi:hypothetical protein
MITGYGRIITYSEQYGVEKIQEGKFFEGNLVGLGRSHAMEKSVPSKFYNTEQHYTGWYPDTKSSRPTFVGNGIAVTNKNFIKQGTFGVIEGFPNGGKDFVSPSDLFEYDIYTL